MKSEETENDGSNDGKNECSIIDETEDIDRSLNKLSQDDPKLIQTLKDKYLIGPNNKPLNLRRPPSNKLLKGQFGQPEYLDENFFK